MTSAVWNWTTTLANDPYFTGETPVLRFAARRRKEPLAPYEPRREMTAHEANQLVWTPAPGRLLYAGAEEDLEE